MKKILTLALIIPGAAFYIKHLWEAVETANSKSKRLGIIHNKPEINEKVYVSNDIAEMK